LPGFTVILGVAQVGQLGFLGLMCGGELCEIVLNVLKKIKNMDKSKYWNIKCKRSGDVYAA
jgi:hypothetical protein